MISALTIEVINNKNVDEFVDSLNEDLMKKLINIRLTKDIEFDTTDAETHIENNIENDNDSDVEDEDNFSHKDEISEEVPIVNSKSEENSIF